MMGVLAAHAEEYPYLTFELTDGTKASVDVSSLQITINGNTLTAGSQTFELTNLSKMYFSGSNESTGISETLAGDLDTATEIYDLQGRKLTKYQMHKGIYVIKTNKGNFKVNVK